MHINDDYFAIGELDRNLLSGMDESDVYDGLDLRFFAITIQNMGLCSLSQHLRSLQFLPVCSHSDALSIQGIDVE
ncbi:MAG: hypothetical protein RMY64_26725 [Nostoc sp. DedQUE08]|uniref:hypothetical protein n=1 Tax=unclassified Nostoc TaxID=2593658 RepID=UPI002AD23B74|nr:MULTISPECIES: hypothetical protein [unclassified Nostoc]MDZ8069166.1 hypothetical protein [Nostoc sp. DedQUE08]MDZ8093233.1 hypothetical protein [Nostoc sp. DedQUE05]